MTRKHAWPNRCPIGWPWWFTFSRSALRRTDSLMWEQAQCIHENMRNTHPNKTLRIARQPLFSNHFIEVIDDLRCPLIEG